MLRRIVFLGALIGIWEVIFRFQIWPPFMFPSPLNVAQTLIHGFQDGSFIIALKASFQRLLMGYSLAVFIGIFLGVSIAKSKIMNETVGMLVIGLQSVPSIVWLPLALLWFGMSETAITFIVTLGGTWTMTTNTATGIRNVQPVLTRAARTMGASGWHLFLKVTLPASVPHLITGMRLSWAFAWRALMAGELIGSGSGLGQMLNFGRDVGNMSLVLSIMVIIAVIGMILDNLVFQRIEKNVLTRWGLAKV
ncbi:ABC-type nitrate/sulfonate/bicarbonate transport system, permease component [Desulfitobacterium dichloroeliminans LMG P-21439]|uniref:ABC-type nitrate/sulfonate/bicarbonate transport system, permease component n=2 Tax=Desulfitobacterium dichloroeliminans TaxID=233055 RepID=L0F7J1_DESDL|nr:ABC-type nitrate/sulfonate/bicarbonate transport system, permease component [Desulfitobacterium dichloroeliminans LMG P-21439]